MNCRSAWIVREDPGDDITENGAHLDSYETVLHPLKLKMEWSVSDREPDDLYEKVCTGLSSMYYEGGHSLQV
jgi:hypothetical protein